MDHSLSIVRPKGCASGATRPGLTPEAIGYDLRLQDAWGTAATRLLNADVPLARMAEVMGWSIRHAAAVIERYAQVLPDESDTVLARPALAREAGR